MCSLARSSEAKARFREAREVEKRDMYMYVSIIAFSLSFDANRSIIVNFITYTFNKRLIVLPKRSLFRSRLLLPLFSRLVPIFPLQKCLNTSNWN